MSVRTEFLTRALALPGDFWLTQLSRESRVLAQACVQSTLPDSIVQQFQELIDGLTARDTGAGAKSDAAKLRVLGSEDVIPLGPDLNARVRTLLKLEDATVLDIIRRPYEYDLRGNNQPMGLGVWSEDLPVAAVGNNSDWLLFPVIGDTPGDLQISFSDDALRVIYLVQIGEHRPAAILNTAGRILLSGVDYSLADGGAFFVSDPYTLFPDGRMLMLGDSDGDKGCLYFPFGVDDTSAATPSLVAKWARGSEGLQGFAQAIAAAAGLRVTERTGRVLRVKARPDMTATYLFDYGPVDVPYPHTALEVGEVVPAGHIMGGGVRVDYGNQPGWLRRINWTAGLPLGGLSPFTGVALPDAVQGFAPYEESTTHPGKWHVRARLQGEEAEVAAFWDYMRFCENNSGRFLNDVLNIPSNSVAYLNPVDVIGEHWLYAKLVIVRLDLNLKGYEIKNRALQFLHRNKLAWPTIILEENDYPDS